MRRFISLVLTCLIWSGAVRSQPASPSYKDTQRLLSKMEIPDFDSTLRDLFRLGDERIADLVQALDDKNEAVSLNAQRVIRYLANPVGLKGLTDWYEKRAKT